MEARCEAAKKMFDAETKVPRRPLGKGKRLPVELFSVPLRTGNICKGKNKII